MIRRHRRIVAAALAVTAVSLPCAGVAADFGPANPFYAPSTLPFQAPPFDRIKDSDYQPAIEAGMALELAEIKRIADNPAAPTFANTFVAMEKSGLLLSRALAAFRLVSEADTNPTLQSAKAALAPKIAAHEDAIHLDKRLFERVAAVYKTRAALRLDAESLRLVEFTHRRICSLRRKPRGPGQGAAQGAQ